MPKVAVVTDSISCLPTEILKEYDIQLLSGGEIRWRNTAQWARYDLLKKGFLKKDMPRGYWEISDEGRAFLEKELASTMDKDY